MTVNNSLERCYWADIVRIVAIISVVLVHASATAVGWWGRIPTDWWQVSNYYNAAVRIGVPLFIILSGALLLGKNERYSVFFKKRFKRVVVPYFFWIILFVLFKHYYEKDFYHKDFESVKKIFTTLYSGTFYYHLGFLNALLGVYLMVPIVRKFVQNAAAHDIKYFIVLWFLFSSIIPTASFLFDSQIDISIYQHYVPLVTGVLGYFLLGYVITQFNFRKDHIAIAFAIFMICYLITAMGTSILTERTGRVKYVFYDYLSPTVILMSVSAFILIKHVASKYNNNLSKLKNLGILSKASFGVFFIHVIFLRLLLDLDSVLGFKLHGFAFNPLLAVPVTAIITLILSYAAILLLVKIPVVKNLIT